MKRTKFAVSLAGLVLLAFQGAAAIASPEPPVPPEGCRYVEKGRPGPAGNWLLIERDAGGVGLRREGRAIVVYAPVVEGKALTCEGPKPTVDNIDRIVYRPPGGGDPPRISHRLDVDLVGGMFEPGASPDHSRGGAEIEIVAEFPREPPNKWSTIHALGGDASDWIRMGALSHGRTGVNLDLRHDHSVPDADLIVSAATDAHFSLRGEDGNDRIGATGMGPEFLGPIPQRGLEIRGGDGRDTLYSGSERDVVDGGAGADTVYGEEGNDSLSGGEGNDRLFGGAGDDYIAAGSDETQPFYDLLSGGSGRDALHAIDRNTDTIGCGAGPDQAYVDAIDEWSRSTCEKQHGPDFN